MSPATASSIGFVSFHVPCDSDADAVAVCVAAEPPRVRLERAREDAHVAHLAGVRIDRVLKTNAASGASAGGRSRTSPLVMPSNGARGRRRHQLDDAVEQRARSRSGVVHDAS